MYNSTSSTDNISRCPFCGTNLKWDNKISGYECLICGYKETIIAGEPIIWNLASDSAGLAAGRGELESNTLHIHSCEKVKFTANGIEITADLGNVNLSKYDAIEINGHKFERVKGAEDSLTLTAELNKSIENDVNIDKYSDSVYNSFRTEVCPTCRYSNVCSKSKLAIYTCRKFESYFEI